MYPTRRQASPAARMAGDGEWADHTCAGLDVRAITCTTNVDRKTRGRCPNGSSRSATRGAVSPDPSKQHRPGPKGRPRRTGRRAVGLGAGTRRKNGGGLHSAFALAKFSITSSPAANAASAVEIAACTSLVGKRLACGRWRSGPLSQDGSLTRPSRSCAASAVNRSSEVSRNCSPCRGS